MSANPLLRRYTPPTCVLEISAQHSALSRWSTKALLNHLRFQLNFNDPRVSEDQWVTLKGDRTQLEALTEAVTRYVQDFLNQSSLRRSNTLQQGDSSGGLAVLETETLPPELQSTYHAQGIFLQPRGLLSHTLSLGNLATETTGQDIILSSTQLADLSTALEEFLAEASSLPQLVRPAWSISPALWTRVAAGALITLGLAASLLKSMPSNAPITTALAPSSTDQRSTQTPVSEPSSSPILTPPDGSILAPQDGSIPPSGLINTPPDASTTDIPTPAVSDTTTPQAQSSPDSSGILPPAPPTSALLAPPTPPPSEITLNPTKIPPIAKSLGRTSIPSMPKQSSITPPPVLIPPSTNGSPLPSSPDGMMLLPETEVTLPDAQTAREAIANAKQFSVQEQEARARFSTWQPPEGLADTAQYRIEVKGDGTVQSTTPINQFAKEKAVLDRSGMPLQGDTLTTAPKNGKPFVLRVLLKPDGNVDVRVE